uniref:Selenium binding protein 2 n=1 Tax=Mus musculus TaxID=10090 RepID=G3UWX5_MOUSE
MATKCTKCGPGYPTPLEAMKGHPQVAHALPEGRAAPLRMEHLQQLLWGQHEVTQQADTAWSHVLPHLRGGCGL